MHVRISQSSSSQSKRLNPDTTNTDTAAEAESNTLSYLPTALFQDKWVYNDTSNKCEFNKHLLNAYYVPETTHKIENIVVNKAKNILP